MPSPSIRRCVVLFLLALAVAAPRVTAAGPLTAHFLPTAAASAAPSGLIGRLWSLFTSLWSEEGCMMDPSGRCAGQTVAPPAANENLDTGCMMDPDGRCKDH